MTQLRIWESGSYNCLAYPMDHLIGCLKAACAIFDPRMSEYSWHIQSWWSLYLRLPGPVERWVQPIASQRVHAEHSPTSITVKHPLDQHPNCGKFRVSRDSDHKFYIYTWASRMGSELCIRTTPLRRRKIVEHQLVQPVIEEILTTSASKHRRPAQLIRTTSWSPLIGQTYSY